MNRFMISPSDHGIWNHDKLVQFLVQNQRQHICLILQNEGCDCASIGLYQLLDNFEFASVTIETANPLENHPVYKIKLSPLAFRFFDLDQQHDDYSGLHHWNHNKIFGMFYNRPIWHRLGLFAHMYDRYQNQTLINFRSQTQSPDDRELTEMQQLFVRDPQGAQLFLKHCHDLPIIVERQDSYTIGATTTQHTNQLCNFYPNIMIDLVAETFVNGFTFYATEKTIRPMLLKKPFICMAAQDHCVYLRQMGFRTFYEFWNEDYDGFAGVDRYLQIVNLIDDLSKKSLAELIDMYKNMQHILDHNYELLVHKKFSCNVTKI